MPVDVSDVPFRLLRANRPTARSGLVELTESRPEYHCLASNTRIEIRSGVHIGILRVAKGLRRVHVKGGTFDAIEFEVPTSALEVSTDLVFEGCSWRASEEHHMRIYARRMEFIECRSVGDWYACFASDAPDNDPPIRFKMGDFLFCDCDFQTNDGRQACVRLHDVTRLVVKNSVVRSGGNKGLRIHGNTRYLFIRNLRCEDSNRPGSGIHLGEIGGGSNSSDRANIQRVWLQDITCCVTGNPDIDIDRGEATDIRRCIDVSVRHLTADNVWSYSTAEWSAWENIAAAPCPTWTITNSGRRVGACPPP